MRHPPMKVTPMKSSLLLLKRISRSSAFVLALAAFTSFASAADSEVRLIVKRKAAGPDVPFRAMISAHGAQMRGTVGEINAKIVSVPKAQAAKLMSNLQGQSDTEYVEIDGTAHALTTANDPLYTQGLEWHIAKIQAPSAWDITMGSSNVIVAVVDTGVYASHPDLSGKILSGGWDFVGNDADPTDENGHGTAVAGTIAPNANNSVGVVGVAWANQILPVRVLDASGSGSYSSIAQGITYAANHGARIINLSLGGTSSSLTLQDAINYAWSKNCILVAAAGNNGNSTPVYPAACSNVVSVAATDSSDAHTSWSSYGSYVDMCAPGDSIVTLDGSNGYASWSGTSFSTPVTSGVLALMASANSQLSNSQLVDVLLKNCDDLGATGKDVYYGAGRVNALRAVSAAKTYVVADTTAPTVKITSPFNKSTISGTASVSVSASDSVGVTRVELYVDSKLVTQSTTATTVFSLNTLTYTNGTHTILTKAYDAAGNTGSASISVTIKNTVPDTIAPTTAITSPTNGTKLSNTQKIAVSCSDNVAVTKLELYVDGVIASTTIGGRLPSYLNYSWNTSRLAIGSHTLQAYAYDAAGNVGASTVINVTK